MFAELLRKHLGSKYSINEWQMGALRQHCDLLLKWNQRINLTGLNDLEEIVVRHYCESIALAAALPFGKLRVMDVGSGAGFPGVPIAVMREDCFVHLVEADGRKSIFLREATVTLRNCLVVRARLDVVRQECDWMVSRAVRWQDVVEGAVRLSDRIALLVSRETADEVIRESGLFWSSSSHLPWGDHRVILEGRVSRGTL